jgi:AcrR family transcriptional regulator
MRAFGEHGYKDTRVEDILQAAGVSRPTFYKFFANRDEVFDAIAESQAFTVIQSMRGAIAMASDPLERLDRALDAYLRWRAATGPIGTVLNAEAMRPGSHASQQRKAILDAVTSWFTTEAGDVVGPDVDPLLYVGLVAALERIGADLDRQTRVGEKEIERCKQVMLQIVLGTLAWGRDLETLLERIARLRKS